jgi:hypothetical protein
MHSWPVLPFSYTKTSAWLFNCQTSPLRSKIVYIHKHQSSYLSDFLLRNVNCMSYILHVFLLSVFVSQDFLPGWYIIYIKLKCSSHLSGNFLEHKWATVERIFVFPSTFYFNIHFFIEDVVTFRYLEPQSGKW